MEIIKFKEANCKSCYKCIRNCELKAIKFSNDQARIMEEACVLCGKCTHICPQNAKYIKSEVSIIKDFLLNKEKVYLSLAPSYVSAFDKVSFAKISNALKKLGFTHVEETAIGATEVSKEYGKLMQEKTMTNIITTCCYTTVMLIEKYYPELVASLAPVKSPMICHAEMMKLAYGTDIKVIFAGPCISKKQEAKKNNFVDAVILFEELKDWFEQLGINLEEEIEDVDIAEMHNTKSRMYPVPGGIIKSIPSKEREAYKLLSVDGLNRCIATLDSIKDNEIKGYFIEMSACGGSCVDGPGIRNKNAAFLVSKDVLLTNSKKITASSPIKTEEIELDVSETYSYKGSRGKMPSEEAIKEILASIGKYDESTMLNCGTCGYQTCRDKAIAVYQNKADLKMCLPYLREKAESKSNMILENTPNAIFVLDKNYNIIEYNNKATKLFDFIEGRTIGFPIYLYLNSDALEKAKKTGKNIYDYPAVESNGTLFTEQSVVQMPNGDYLLIVKDVTNEMNNQLRIEAIRKDTMEIAQKVIDKQMIVAQEIASLLGETTGETKVALMKLKKSIQQGTKDGERL